MQANILSNDLIRVERNNYFDCQFIDKFTTVRFSNGLFCLTNSLRHKNVQYVMT